MDVTAEQPWGDPMSYLDSNKPFFAPGMQVQHQDHQVFMLGATLTRLAGEPLRYPDDRGSKFLCGPLGPYWWTSDAMSDGKRPWSAAPPRTYTAHGHSGNSCFVIPEWNTVVVRMGTSPIAPLAQQDVLWNTFFKILANATNIIALVAEK